MNIDTLQETVIQEFASLSDWLDKYEYLIQLAKESPVILPEHRVEKNVVLGCQSAVWVSAELTGDRISYVADSDTMITKGLIAVILKVLNNQPAKVISDADLFFIDKIGLKSNLSPSRANGLMSIVKRMKQLAEVAYSSLEDCN